MKANQSSIYTRNEVEKEKMMIQLYKVQDSAMQGTRLSCVGIRSEAQLLWYTNQV
ncbi:hypothetical protein K402DRAFT_390363 [Aulographum hederae CBS 113979]|uniref:Uncharacterized protein n=1 Tax=Aulographum hederae CBS 113979 TaxID=1176131 RepID=A0A6G1GTS7_9PEZI|nr:hypothetical protein K402DRAFT_397751 [Aulographum hederae CBS 113979]KAF1983896.1 hypothetical protein K402DRAFT_396360 [Aulographum hederae CBS 113979]KAF1984159.1 hypothetical protein K402DRAFT_396079 [Aulographum hederae CBS 113979]KAF1987298.1 hypothetical protein K402DRAFT_392998 [Aulographum hederae CBS 113979]KAF1989667.1 hypothetical protein K402DRAFT_390629 [Aulographum hederae CBS 113979]